MHYQRKEGQGGREGGKHGRREKESIFICFWRVEGRGSDNTLLFIKNEVILLLYSKMLKSRDYFYDLYA